MLCIPLGGVTPHLNSIETVLAIRTLVQVAVPQLIVRGDRTTNADQRHPRLLEAQQKLAKEVRESRLQGGECVEGIEEGV